MQPPNPLIPTSGNTLPVVQNGQPPAVLPPIAQTYTTGITLILSNHERQDQEIEKSYAASQRKVDDLQAQIQAVLKGGNHTAAETALLQDLGRRANVEIPTTMLQGVQPYIDAKNKTLDDTVQRLHKMDEHAIDSCSKIVQAVQEAREKDLELDHKKILMELEEQRLKQENQRKRQEADNKEAERSAKAAEDNRHLAATNRIQEEKARTGIHN